ncbi:unnamed protein product, partial [Discosporangium mesarthrocarpum]
MVGRGHSNAASIGATLVLASVLRSGCGAVGAAGSSLCFGHAGLLAGSSHHKLHFANLSAPPVYTRKHAMRLFMQEVIAERHGESVKKSIPAVIVARGKARLFWEGNPLVYGGAVARVQGRPLAGDIVDVLDSSGKFIAWGLYNPDSMYRVRILVRDGEKLAHCRDVRTVVRERLKVARRARRAIGIPNEETNTYRCVNGEGDRLSGLVVDVFAGVLGVSSSALWVEAHRADIEAALQDEFGPGAEIVWRRSDGRLQQDGWKGRGGGEGGAEMGGAEVGGGGG